MIPNTGRPYYSRDVTPWWLANVTDTQRKKIMLINTVKTSDTEDEGLFPDMKPVWSFEPLKTIYQSTKRITFSKTWHNRRYTTTCRLTSAEANRHILCTCSFEDAEEIQLKVRGFYRISAREHPVERFFIGYKNLGAKSSVDHVMKNALKTCFLQAICNTLLLLQHMC